MTTMTAENINEKVERSNIHINPQMTHVEYRQALLDFQSMVAQRVSSDESEIDMRLDEAIFRLEALARKNGMQNNPSIRSCIHMLKKVNKEISISMAGKNAEDRVAHSLEYVTRDDVSSFRNVYIADNDEETELDNIVLTDSGIVILEIKSTKSDIAISEDGRLLYGNDECYEKRSFGEKMQVKRRLLKEKIEVELRERKLDIPVYIDSFLVFSVPKAIHVRINDQYRQEKYCFSGKVQHIINDYTSEIHYTPDDLVQLNEILSNIESCKKCFEVTLDIDEIGRDFAEALTLLQQDEPEFTRNDERNTESQTLKSPSAMRVVNWVRASTRTRTFIFGGLFAGLFVAGALAGAVNSSGK